MAGRGRSRWREIGFVGGALGLGVALGAVVVALSGWDLSTAANVAQLVSVAVPAPALLAGLVMWRRRSAESTTAHEVRAGVQVNHDSISRLPVPRQLPADAPSFVGRETDLAALDALLADDSEARSVVISAITGGGGVGKTTLAVHWAHRVRERFPDGDLFVDLRGYDPGQPVRTEQALDGFLRALDVPAEKIPVEVEARAALFRSLLAGRRMLVILDNAASVEQVRPLLPGSAGCLALITSRSHLSGLTAREGAGRVPIDVLSPDDAMDLLRQVIGDTRVDAEPTMATRLARRCDYLPLALRIAADRAATHPHLGLRDLVEELVDEHDRLEMLTSDGDETTAVRAVFSWSYKKLPPDVARVFRLLSLHAGPDLSGEAAAILTDLAIPGARRLLDKLTSQHLLKQTGRNRYRFHNLLRAYAAERTELEESDAERAAIVRRLLRWYLHTAQAARHTIVPNTVDVSIEQMDPGYSPLIFSTYEAALEWYEEERINLVAAVHQATETGQDTTAWRLAYVQVSFLWVRWYLNDWDDILHAGLAAARRLGDQSAQAELLNDLGDRSCALEQFDKAVSYFEQALPLIQQVGPRRTAAFCLNGLGTAYTGLGQFDDAVDHLQQALTIFRDVGERRGEGTTICNLGAAWRDLGRLEDAIACQREAAGIFEATGNQESQAWALRRLGDVYCDQECPGDAVGPYQEALTIYRGLGMRREVGVTLVGLGEAQLASGQTEAARHSWQQAVAIFKDLGDSQATEVKARLAAMPLAPERTGPAWGARRRISRCRDTGHRRPR